MSALKFGIGVGFGQVKFRNSKFKLKLKLINSYAHAACNLWQAKKPRRED